MTLFEAVRAQDLPQLTQALQRVKDVNVLGDERRTPLIEAAALGFQAGVAALLAAGAEPTWKDEGGETALLKAAANGHVGVVALLLPLAAEDEQDLARAFLKAAGEPQKPEYTAVPEGLARAAAQVAARAATFVGHDEPAERLARVERSEHPGPRRK